MASSSDSDWERLPLNLQESILLLLPISTLLVCKSLSRSFLHTIRSPSFLSAYSLRRSRHLDDLIFLLFIDGIGARRPSAIAFLPIRASWIHLPLPISLCHIHTSSGCLVVAEKFEGGQFVSDLLCRTVTPIAPMSFHSYILSLVEDEASTDFKIVSSSKNVIDGGILRPSYCQVYNSASRRWESSGQFPHHYAMLGNAILLNDQLGIVLFCNTREFSIIMFDMSSKIWSRAPDCEQPKSRKSWIGHALVPSVQLLK
ncbi:F-box/kelch-repeat protein At5g43190-like isoform X2 [Zingiber officinale]|uniref:F-box/kelch-repeat protein At5g43190-like isoform X2 n=1 Tax=Zingiber officinale TaxID=94328 RepID=UPI001C4B758C|nr:F-box/kelch-repeat protein At5g43190-like isoform X2 [Zingiber officinale]